MSLAASTNLDQADSFMDRHHFLLRRLHSLSGVMPVGVFVIFHLFTNAQVVLGDYQHEVEFIHNMPALLMLEIFGLWLPIGFHAALGVVYTVSGKSNVRNYPHADNWRYLFQRITGIIALVFIFLHIATLRWGWNVVGWYTPFYVHSVVPGSGEIVGTVTAATAAALQASVLVTLLYIVGVLSVVYHWSNGLWTAAITWGLTISVAAQRRWGYVCLALFLALATFSALAVVGSLTYGKQDAQGQPRKDWQAYEYMVALSHQGQAKAVTRLIEEHQGQGRVPTDQLPAVDAR